MPPASVGSIFSGGAAGNRTRVLLGRSVQQPFRLTVRRWPVPRQVPCCPKNLRYGDVSLRSGRCGGPTGRNSATAWPSRVTITRSPRSTRASTSPHLLRSSRTVTDVTTSISRVSSLIAVRLAQDRTAVHERIRRAATPSPPPSWLSTGSPCFREGRSRRRGAIERGEAEGVEEPAETAVVTAFCEELA